MKITVILGAPLSTVIGQNKVFTSMEDGATVDDLLKELYKSYPNFDIGLRGKGLPVVQNHNIYRLIVNTGFVPWEEAATTVLNDEDLIYLMLPFNGG